MVSLYWFTSTLPRGLYHAALVKGFLEGNPHPISKEKPLGYSLFPHDLALLPNAWAKQIYPNLVLFRTHPAVSNILRFVQP
jgi:microsomal epoxide hydrolase